jgi:hypothetical protein
MMPASQPEPSVRPIQQTGDGAGGLPAPDEQVFAPRLSGVGSLRRELEAVLAAAPPGADHSTYRRLILELNAAGKATASMRMWTWKRLKIRYLLDLEVPEFHASASRGPSHEVAAHEERPLAVEHTRPGSSHPGEGEDAVHGGKGGKHDEATLEGEVRVPVIAFWMALPTSKMNTRSASVIPPRPRFPASRRPRVTPR